MAELPEALRMTQIDSIGGYTPANAMQSLAQKMASMNPVSPTDLQGGVKFKGIV